MDAMYVMAERTVDELESRLRRIQYVMAGYSDSTERELDETKSAGAKQTIPTRLESLKHGLSRLSQQSRVVGEVIRMHADDDRRGQLSSSFAHEARDERSPSVQAMLAMIAAQAALFPRALSDLEAIHEIPVPSSERSIDVVALAPRTARLERVLEKQADEIAELRERSAAALWRWYRINILAGGECSAEWEQRLAIAERTLTRMEKMREQQLSG